MSSALVVGVGPGLGLSLARRFGGEGLTPTLVARDDKSLARLAADLASDDIQATGAPGDIANEEALRLAIQECIAKAGPVDVAIFNASEFVEGPPSSVDVAAFEHGLKVGLTGALIMIQEVVAGMTERGAGTILITGSAAGLKPWVPGTSLSVQKAAVRMLGLAAAAELKSHGIHVAVITVNGMIKQGTPFDADAIAEAFWQVHAQSPDQWESDVIFNGANVQ